MAAKRIVTVLLCLLLLLLLSAGLVAVSVVRYAGVDETRAADCVVVLGAGTWEGEVSPVFAERLRHAADLYRSGLAPKIILTGGLDPRNTVTDAEAARRWLAREGIPAEDIYMEEKSRYTHENFVYAGEIMEREGLRDALVVSDPLHMKRAMLCAADFGVTGYPSPTPTSMYRSMGAKAKFLLRETGCMMLYGAWRVFGVPAARKP